MSQCDPVEASDGTRGVKTSTGDVDVEFRHQCLQAHRIGPFVEVASDGSCPLIFAQSVGQDSQLHPPVAPQQPKVHRRQEDLAPTQFNLGQRRPARFQTGQVDPLRPEQLRIGPKQNGVAVRPKTVTKPKRHRPPARGCEQVTGDGRWPDPKPLVSLLQRQDVGPRGIGDPKDSGRVSPPVETDGLADIVAGNPDQPGRLRPRLRRRVIGLVWATFACLALTAAFLDRPTLAGVAVLSLILSIVPVVLAARLHIILPLPFVVALAIFLAASLLLGEAFDMYERVWWWDLALHGVAATGLGMAGFLFVLMLFEGDRFAAPVWALTLIAVCVAVTLGVMWELFEFAMDQMFGLSMQKSGLADTMGDLVADLAGSILGGLIGALYLTGTRAGFATALLGQFVRINARLFRRRG